MDKVELDAEILDIVTVDQYQQNWSQIWNSGIRDDYEAIQEEDVRASLQRLVEAGEICLVEGETDAWQLLPPKSPHFVNLVAARVGLKPLQSYANYNGDCHDHKIVLEPLIRKTFYPSGTDLEKKRREEIERESHCLIFRQIVEYEGENGPWLCLLKEHECYAQTPFGDEAGMPATSEEAFDGLLVRLTEKIELLQKTKSILLKTRGINAETR